jgi:hypothetical protein
MVLCWVNTKSGPHGLKRNKEKILKSKKANVVIIVSQYSLYPPPRLFGWSQLKIVCWIVECTVH